MFRIQSSIIDMTLPIRNYVTDIVDEMPLKAPHTPGKPNLKDKVDFLDVACAVSQKLTDVSIIWRQ
jgi:hypothetical protein